MVGGKSEGISWSDGLGEAPLAEVASCGDGTGTATPGGGGKREQAGPGRRGVGPGPEGLSRGEKKAESYLSCCSTGAPSGTGAAAMVLRGEAGAGGERRGRRCRGDPRDL